MTSSTHSERERERERENQLALLFVERVAEDHDGKRVPQHIPEVALASKEAYE
jgi:hypothetical protein